VGGHWLRSKSHATKSKSGKASPISISGEGWGRRRACPTTLMGLGAPERPAWSVATESRSSAPRVDTWASRAVAWGQRAPSASHPQQKKGSKRSGNHGIRKETRWQQESRHQKRNAMAAGITASEKKRDGGRNHSIRKETQWRRQGAGAVGDRVELVASSGVARSRAGGRHERDAQVGQRPRHLRAPRPAPRRVSARPPRPGACSDAEPGTKDENATVHGRGSHQPGLAARPLSVEPRSRPPAATVHVNGSRRHAPSAASSEGPRRPGRCSAGARASARCSVSSSRTSASAAPSASCRRARARAQPRRVVRNGNSACAPREAGRGRNLQSDRV